MVIEVIHHAFGGRERGLKDKEDLVGVLNVLLLLGGGHWRVLIEKQGLQFLLLFLRLHSENSTVVHWVAASQESCAVRVRSPWGIRSVVICVSGALWH